ncbi:PAS domain S-box protein [Flavobacteriaceae bacterium TP-CH-4]|uniref:histidine kinase n=1 Tax=Pelagihabitans pacificus TaxID=2696054 RepID=A0A967E7Z1_9FLAO|nr:PAS domain S-box protein [Pelagihabitans pacificus]NHF60754.1 PAS domain S-box protein [Pelagihabitans pacificus]
MIKSPLTEVNNYLIKQLPTATAFLNTKLEVVYASDTWIDYFNFGNRNVFGKKILDLFEKTTRNWEKTLKDCLKGKNRGPGMEHYVDSEKKDRWFEWTNIPWYDENENVIGVIIQTKDITRKVSNELEFEKLQILHDKKSEIAKIGSWNFDLASQKLSWCKMTKKIHEVPLDFVPDIETGINFYKQGHSRNTISLAVERAMSQGAPWNEKLQIVTAKGNEKWVIAAGKPLFKNNELVGILGTFQDIDDQVQAEMKIRESERLLRTLIDNLPLNVFIKDRDSKKILVNKAECDFLGVKHPKQVLGKDDFDLYPKKTAQESRNEDIKVMNSLKPVLGKETICEKKDGQITTFLTSKIPLVGNDGIANGLIGISLDISNIKQKEEELRDLIDVTALQNKKLVNFAHIVSHNLRSHSANFSMLLDFLVNEKCGKEKENLINMLVEASDNLLDTLENLNEVVAINTNTNLNKKPVVLNDMVKKVTKNLNAFLLNNNAKIVNTISDDMRINVVPAYLESILMNFITNSVKYKEPTRNPIIRLHATKNEGQTLLEISDNGLGIDMKKYGDKLFGMYKTFHEHKDARGIGLYITKNQIEAMNGKVMVCSEVGKGSIFKIYFNERN